MGDIVQRLLNDNAMRFAGAMALIETFADFCLKKYAMTDQSGFLFASLGGYGSIIYIFQRALRKEMLGRVNGGWNAFTTISNVLAGMSLGESYSFTQLVGFILIACGIILI
jgi:multidrug transporter EmrE-like cation transporter